MCTEYNVPSSGKQSILMDFFCPDWLQRNQKITLLHDNVYKQGYLNINDDNLWEFLMRDKEGWITFCTNLYDIQNLWKMQIQENSFNVGWQDNLAHQVFGIGWHISAANLHTNYAPGNLKIALVGSKRKKNTIVWANTVEFVIWCRP